MANQYEAIFMGPKGSVMRYNNGEANYLEFRSGKPVAIPPHMVQVLREDKQFTVRAVVGAQSREEEEGGSAVIDEEAPAVRRRPGRPPSRKIHKIGNV